MCCRDISQHSVILAAQYSLSAETLNKTFEMLLSIISFDCFLECDCILGDLRLPLYPWSLYNSNCVQICMSSACHFPRIISCMHTVIWESLTVTANPSLFTPHMQFHIYLCICTLLKPRVSRTDSMWQLNITSPCIWGSERLRLWQKYILHMMHTEVYDGVLFHQQVKLIKNA